jgi:hypothetical protein
MGTGSDSVARVIKHFAERDFVAVKLQIGEVLEFASTANDRNGWSQIAATVESCVRDLVAHSRTT